MAEPTEVAELGVGSEALPGLSVASPHPKLTGPLRWFWAVARAPLDKFEKLTMYALGPHLNWDTWVCRPSMAVMARNSGLSDRGVQQVLDRLAGRSLVTYLVRSRGGRTVEGRGLTHVLRVEIDAIDALNPEPASGLAGAQGAPQPRTPRHPTTKPVQATPNPVRTNRPSIHNRPCEQTIHGAGDRDARARSWMDGPNAVGGNLHATLVACGVEGPFLDALAGAPGLSANEVRADWASINGDRRVREATAVLVRRLAKRHGVKVSSKRAITPEVQKLADDMTKRRREYADQRAREQGTSQRRHGSVDGDAGS